MGLSAKSFSVFSAKIARVLTWGCILSASVYIFSHYKRAELPKTSQIQPAMYTRPEQQLVSAVPFEFSFKGKSYMLQPKANYNIKGLLVSHNNIHSVFDAYHNWDSVDVKDVCLMWGSNLKNNLQNKLKIWNETWTCNFQTNDQETWESFNMSELSNNHLLAATSTVEKAISNLNLGDQIELEGLLVDYYTVGASETLRPTSLTRDDTGNGACEVLFVKNVRVLKGGNPGWNRIYKNSLNLLWLFLALKIASFVAFPLIEYRLLK